MLDTSKLQHFLHQNNINIKQIREALKFYLHEDLQNIFIKSDITTKYTIKNVKEQVFNVVCKQDSDNGEIILCGISFVGEIFKLLKSNITITKSMQDGSVIKNGDIVIECRAKSDAILTAERTILNIIQQLSAVATKTYKLQNIVDNYCTTNNIGKISVLDTRKTLIGGRLLQKYAVFTGGGKNHRIGLYDQILIKDNHIDASGGVENLIKNFKKPKNVVVEIECETQAQVDLVIQNAHLFDIIMLDNFSPQDVKTLSKLIKSKTNLQIEVSGGINQQNILSYCHSGVDFISMGAMTHTISSVDFSLQVKNS